MRLIWPKQLRPSATREALDAERLNEVFRIGVASGLIDDALLPALAQTTSRRLGLLAYLRGSDFQTKHGVTIVRIDGVAFDSQKGKWYRAPYKTSDSLNFFVLHKLWDECGLTDWAKEQGDTFIFRQLHSCADPADAASKRCGRLLQKAGAIGCNIEVPHALRHGAKDAMVDAAIEGETRRKQMGQSTRIDVHDDYGSNRSLTREECQKLARLPLMEAVDWSVFKQGCSVP
jgi:integrase